MTTFKENEKQNEKDVLIYGEGVVGFYFADRGTLDYVIDAYKVMDDAVAQGMTYREFREKFPEIWDWIKYLYPDPDEEEDDGEWLNQEFGSIEVDPYAASFGLRSVARTWAGDNLPSEILYEFATYDSIQEEWHFDTTKEKEIVEALHKLGYECVYDDDGLIWESMNGGPF